MGMLRDALNAEAYDRTYTNKELVSRIGVYFRPYTRLVLVIITVSLLALFGAITPVLIATGVGAMSNVQTDNSLLLAGLVGMVLILGVVTWGVNYARRLLTAQLMGDVILDMRTDAFRSVMNHDMSFFDENQSGRIVSRITSDTDEFGRVAVLITEVCHQGAAGGDPHGVPLHHQLAAHAAAAAAGAGGLHFVASVTKRWARRITRKSQQAVADVNASIQEAVTGIPWPRTSAANRASTTSF
jgi:ATP-binding cassette subfamily B protein